MQDHSGRDTKSHVLKECWKRTQKVTQKGFKIIGKFFKNIWQKQNQKQKEKNKWRLLKYY